ncbi:MAG: hypothetical protein NT034_03985 [Candidatus Magasanikbacteria bacterium]|nr:hypothetical protein [Candidatus Magasanikbacteria bacterium]
MNDQPICRVCGQNHITGACVGDARVSIPAIKRPDTGPEVIDDDVSGPVKFFDVPQDPNMKQLGDDDITPVSVKKTVPKDTVTELSLADIHQGLRGGDVAKASTRGDEHRRHVEKISQKELEHVFDDVANNRDAEVVGFIKRATSSLKFENPGQFELFVKDLFGGDNDPVGAWKLEDIVPFTQMTVEMRVQIGDSRPIVEIVLVNENGQGVRKGQNITRVSEVKIQTSVPKIDLAAEEKRVDADPSLWKKATGWFRMTRGNSEDKK